MGFVVQTRYVQLGITDGSVEKGERDSLPAVTSGGSRGMAPRESDASGAITRPAMLDA
jgi:hypothetical protein